MGGGDEAEGGDGPDPAGGVWTRGRRSISRAFPQNHPRPRPASRLFLPLDLPRFSARAKRRDQSSQSERRPTREEDYAYDDDHDDRDDEEEDSFNFPRGQQSSAKPNTEGFNENL